MALSGGFTPIEAMPKWIQPFTYLNPVLKGTPQDYMAALGQTTTKVFSLNPWDRLESRYRT
jgi:hypothetical protein